MANIQQCYSLAFTSLCMTYCVNARRSRFVHCDSMCILYNCCVCAGLCYTTTIAVLCCAVAMNFSMSNQITKMNECSINGIEYAVICCIARYESESRAFCLHIRCVCMVAGMRLSQTAFFVRYIDQLIIVYKMFD